MHEENPPEETRLITRRRFLKRVIFASATVALGSVYSSRVEPHWIEVERRELPLSRLDPVFDGLTIAQISDLHIGGWMNRERLVDLAKSVNALQADYVVITGDFVSLVAPHHLAALREGLSTLSPRHGVLGVLGNHDHWTNAAAVSRVIKKVGVQELANDFHTIKRDGKTLHFCGLDDAWAKAARPAELLRKLPSHGAAILLAHEPDFADEYSATGRFDIQLAGHSHGGQIRMPFVGPLHLPPFGRKYHTGHYEIGQGKKSMQLYVNRGAGMVWPFVRFDCRPEITLFTLCSL